MNLFPFPPLWKDSELQFDSQSFIMNFTWCSKFNMTETIVLQLHIKICIVRSLHTHFCVRIFNKKNFCCNFRYKMWQCLFSVSEQCKLFTPRWCRYAGGESLCHVWIIWLFFSTSSRKSVFKKSFFPSLCNPGATGVTTRVTHCSTQIAVVSERMEEIAWNTRFSELWTVVHEGIVLFQWTGSGATKWGRADGGRRGGRGGGRQWRGGGSRKWGYVCGMLWGWKAYPVWCVPALLPPSLRSAATEEGAEGQVDVPGVCWWGACWQDPVWQTQTQQQAQGELNKERWSVVIIVWDSNCVCMHVCVYVCVCTGIYVCGVFVCVCVCEHMRVYIICMVGFVHHGFWLHISW